MSVTLNRRLVHYPKAVRRTITYDNGSENHEHMCTNSVLGTRSYFCEPYHSWERGTVENTIGLVRRFFPKKTNFAKISKNKVQRLSVGSAVVRESVSGFKTPVEVFKAVSVALIG